MSAGPEVASTTSNVLGTIGTVLWCIQLIPQIIHNYRRKNTEGLPALMLLLWAASGVPFAVYFIVQKSNIPVQVQPNVFLFLALVCWYQCLVYPPRKMAKKRAITYFVVICLLFAGIQAGCIFPFKTLYAKGITWPTTLVGIIAAILLAAGLLPPYWEIYKHQGQVVGINFIFLAIDSGGALFSTLSLVFQRGPLDILGCVLYILILVFEVGIFLSHGIWLLRTRKARKADRQGKGVEQDTDTTEVERSQTIDSGNGSTKGGNEVFSAKDADIDV